MKNIKGIKVMPSKAGIDVFFKDGTDLFIPTTTLENLKATSIPICAGISTINNDISSHIINNRYD